VNISERKSSLWPLALVILTACVVNLPCLLWGLQFGHDHNLHIAYLHFFAAQLRAGEIYPRWISGLNYGAGSPIFFVQYPLPYYGAVAAQWAFRLGATPVGEAHALGVFLVVTGILAGLFSWLWCRALSNPLAAIAGSAAYMTTPYICGADVYFRGAIGEYSALAWVPLALYFAHMTDIRSRRAVAGMALAFAVIVLSNLFMAILFAPCLFLYAICCVKPLGRLRAALSVIYALVLGVGLAGIYLLPMNAHRSFFNLANLIRSGSEIFSYRGHLFRFDETLFPHLQLSLRVVDGTAVCLAFAVIVILLVRLRRSQDPKLLACAAIVCLGLTCAAPFLHRVGLLPQQEMTSPRIMEVRSRIFLITFLTLEAALLAYASMRSWAERIVRVMLGICLGCYFLETQWSDLIWRHVRFLWNIQFPWRLSGLISVFAVGLFAVALREVWDSQSRRRRFLLVGGALWLGIGVASYLALDLSHALARPFFTEIREKVETAYPAYAAVKTWPGADQLGPNDGLGNKVTFLVGDGTATLDNITARHMRLDVDCLSACSLLVKLVYYPFWQAREASGQPIPLKASARAGLTELTLSRGVHGVDLELPIGPGETWGSWLSLISMLIIAALFIGDGRNRAHTVAS
jgi:hypothetical protein